MSTPLRVLIVEDEPDAAMLMVIELQRAGFEPEWARVQTEEEYLAHLTPDLDLILADYTLPKFDALEVLRLLYASGMDVPVIVVTGAASEEVAVECIRQGAADYLLKDRLKRLGSAVQRALDDKRLRDEKREAERRLRLSDEVLQRIGTLVLVADGQGRVTYVSPAVREVLGYPPEDLLGDGWWNLIHDGAEDREKEKRLAASVARGEAPVAGRPYEQRLKHRDGEVRWLLWQDSRGPDGFVIGVGQDITDRKRADEALRQSEERFSKAFRASPIAISISTLSEGRVLDVNDAFLQLVGYRRPEVIGQTVAELALWADPAEHAHMLQALEEKRSVHDLEHRFHTKTGEGRTGLVSAELIELAGERCLLTLVHDITERKRAEGEIRRQTVRAQALARAAARLNAQLGLESVLNVVCEETARALNISTAFVHLYDDRRGEFRFAGGHGVPPAFREQAQPIPRALYDADARQFGSIITIPDMRALPDLPDTALYRSLDLRTVAVASLMRESQLVGTLNIAAFGEVRPITEDEVALLRGLADLAGVAIVNARQHERLQRRLQESEAMAAISRALNETLRLEDVFQIIVDAARQIIPKVERAVIHLLDEEKQALRPAAVAGLSELGRPVYTMRSGEGVAGQVMAEGLVINVGDIRADPRYLPLGPATHLRSLLVAPVQSGARRLGTISVQSAAPHVFSEDDEQLLAILGLQAALAIENARLFEVERRKAAEAEALRQVTQTLISRLKLSEVLNAVVEAIATIANYKYVSVFLLEDDQLVLQAQKGYDAAVHRALRVDQGVTGRVARLQRPTLVPDVTRDRDYISDIPGVQSAIGVPLIVGDQALGVLLVESDVDHPLDRSDLHWLTNAGRQLSVAIENTRLYDHLEKSLVHEKAARAQMVQTGKLAAMGRLVASVAHELNNPLQAIQNALYLVKQEQALSPQAREDLQVALTEADRLADLISRLRETYRPATAEQFRLESINAIVYDVQRLIGTHLRHSQITFEFDPDPELPLLPAIRDQLKQVILNLCLNAVEAMLTGGRLTVRTRYLAALGDIMVTIADTGTGIDPAALPNIFEPFFTTKEGGTGLGLVITYDIIQRHRGRIEVESEIGHGTTFKIWLPVDNNRLPIHNMASETHV